jgi:hypothetical protein
VHQADGVGGVERGQHTVQHRDHLGRRQRAAQGEQVGQAAAGHQVQRQPCSGQTGGPVQARVVHLRDVGVPQPPHGTGLREERVPGGGGAAEVRVQHLERHRGRQPVRPRSPGVRRRVHRRRAADAEQRAEPEPVTEQRPGDAAEVAGHPNRPCT